MEVSGQLHAPAALPPGKEPGKGYQLLRCGRQTGEAIRNAGDSVAKCQ